MNDKGSMAYTVFASDYSKNETDVVDAQAAICKNDKWLLDTGVGAHLVARNAAHAKDITQGQKAVHLRTANGKLDIFDRAYIYVPGLDVEVEAVVLPYGTCALPMGKLIARGYSFSWET